MTCELFNTDTDANPNLKDVDVWAFAGSEKIQLDFKAGIAAVTIELDGSDAETLAGELLKAVNWLAVMKAGNTGEKAWADMTPEEQAEVSQANRGGPVELA